MSAVPLKLLATFVKVIVLGDVTTCRLVHAYIFTFLRHLQSCSSSPSYTLKKGEIGCSKTTLPTYLIEWRHAISNDRSVLLRTAMMTSNHT
jgi:hypothetical protein